MNKTPTCDGNLIPCPLKHIDSEWCLDCRYAKAEIEFPGNPFVRIGMFCSYPYRVKGILK